MADEIRVFSGGAPKEVLERLAPEFVAQTGIKVSFTFALVTVIQDMLAKGEKADLVLLPAPLLAASEKVVPMRAEGKGTLARVGIGVIVPDGTAKPDISSADAVKAALLSAKRIALPDPSTPSGGHLGRMIEQLGIADQVRGRIVNKAAIAGGGELIAKGEADIGMYLLSEVRSIKGVTVVGLLPAAVQSYVVYGMAVPESNAAPEAALMFAQYVTDPGHAEAWQEGGFELVK
jgi:molybdate transport system substrate-binding protein